jgi:hypothetical protein
MMSKTIHPVECQGCWPRYDWQTKTGKERRLPRIEVVCPHCGVLAKGPFSKRDDLDRIADDHREAASEELFRLNPDLPRSWKVVINEGKFMLQPQREEN